MVGRAASSKRQAACVVVHCKSILVALGRAGPSGFWGRGRAEQDGIPEGVHRLHQQEGGPPAQPLIMPHGQAGVIRLPTNSFGVPQCLLNLQTEMVVTKSNCA